MNKYIITTCCCLGFLFWSLTLLHGQAKKGPIPTLEISYEEITINDIKSTRLTSDGNYSLQRSYGAPAIFFYRTNEGRYGKLEYLNKDGFRAIYIRWTTYNADGSIFSGGQANLEVPQHAGCDLDLGLIQQEGADFAWKYYAGTGAYNRGGDKLESRNGAGFHRPTTSNPTAEKTLQGKTDSQLDKGSAKGEITVKPNPVPSSETIGQTTGQTTGLRPSRRIALVIGNAAYPSDAALTNPVNDATDIAAALREIGFEVISTTNADRRKMNTSIDDFGARLKNYDLGFFYYAGHGIQIDGENYLIPIDAVPKSQGEVKYDCYPVGKILAKMEEASNQANIIVLDACRDNPLSRSWSRSLVSGGLANINAPQGTFIGFATSPGSTALDGEGRNGVYTAALLQYLRNPNLTLDQIFNATGGSVKKKTNNQQVPWKASSMSEDLYLRN